ncbi:NlpC/P60 family protein [Citricoccus nitrophenolicus]|uniref:Cell wall-associated NlpC family hydrolase n=1 Tax=Citricoccus muralis TaxID=169134 RepID=A0A3D9LHL0_9MICC|nr:C40 family peptidase [Citricoccus muralis]REE05166.1 cell wall-associated NlpC family hydrolase [Citricoccus muralis]
MSKRSSAARHRAVPANTNPLEAISKAVSSNAGTVGRQAAVVAAASGLVLSIGMPAQGAAPAVRETTSIPAPGLDIERAAVTTVNVAAAKDVKVELDRAPVTSKPAPEPEPTPEPAPEPEYTAASQSESTEQTERSTPSESSSSSTSSSSSSSSDESQESSQESSATQEAAAEPAPAAQSSSVGGVVGAAYAGVGVPYVYGGKTTSGWDCSGFVAWAYAQAGITIPSSTSAIRGSGLFVQTSNPKPGDLVFQNGGGHVGIYVGNGQMIGAQNPSVGTFQHSVTRNPLMGYYTYVG